MNREDCDHKTLMFGSGDYYIFCQDCGAKWMGHDGSSQEYGVSATGKPVGATPETSNKGKGAYLSGKVRHE